MTLFCSLRLKVSRNNRCAHLQFWCWESGGRKTKNLQSSSTNNFEATQDVVMEAIPKLNLKSVLFYNFNKLYIIKSVKIMIDFLLHWHLNQSLPCKAMLYFPKWEEQTHHLRIQACDYLDKFEYIPLRHSSVCISEPLKGQIEHILTLLTHAYEWISLWFMQS